MSDPRIGDPEYTIPTGQSVVRLTTERARALHELIDQLCAAPDPATTIIGTRERYLRGELTGQAYRDLFGILPIAVAHYSGEQDWTADELDAISILDPGDPDDDDRYPDGATCPRCEEVHGDDRGPADLCDRCTR